MKKLIIGISVLALSMISCERDITSLNIDPKNPTVVNPDYIFTSAELGIVGQMANSSVNYNNFRFFTQQITETQYTDEARYNIVKRSMPDNHWTTLYLQLNKLEDAKKQISASTSDEALKKAKFATIEALEIYTFSILVDSYGDVPYSQALQVDIYPSPKYDDAKSIYEDLIKRADKVLSSLPTGNGFNTSDAIFAGDMSKVATFLNSIKLRLGLNLADVDNALAKKTVESAVQGGLIASNAQNIGLTFDTAGQFTSTQYQDMVQSGRNDYVAANTFVDALNANNDPRRNAFFTDINGIFKGGKYGSQNTYALYSHVNPLILVPNSKYNLFDFAETQLMLAEAAERGYSVGGTAANYFNSGITASMTAWGVNAADITTYLGTHNYATLSGSWKEKIGTQAWFATYNRGFEAWEFSRRLDFKTFVKPSSYALPVRLPYPVKEGSVNNENRSAAAVKQWGDVKNDVQTSKIFWDKN